MAALKKNFVAAISALVLVSSTAWADCPDGGACYTAREAQVCLSCLNEVEELRWIARQKERERNDMAAQAAVAEGRLAECRLQLDQTKKDARGPSWWLVAGGVVIGVVVGGVVGVGL